MFKFYSSNQKLNFCKVDDLKLRTPEIQVTCFFLNLIIFIIQMIASKNWNYSLQPLAMRLNCTLVCVAILLKPSAILAGVGARRKHLFVCSLLISLWVMQILETSLSPRSPQSAA